MGNVSYLVPSIHPMIAVAPYGVPIHTPDFATHARSETGDQGVIDGAKIIAMTIIDLWADKQTIEVAQDEFREAIEALAEDMELVHFAFIGKQNLKVFDVSCSLGNQGWNKLDEGHFLAHEALSVTQVLNGSLTNLTYLL